MDSCLSAQLGPPKLYLLHQYPPPLMLYHCNHHSQGTFDRLILDLGLKKEKNETWAINIGDCDSRDQRL